MSETKFAYSSAELMDLKSKLKTISTGPMLRQTGKSVMTLALLYSKFDTYCLISFINQEAKRLSHKLQSGSLFSSFYMVEIIRKHYQGCLPNVLNNRTRKRLKVIIEANLNRALIKKRNKLK